MKRFTTWLSVLTCLFLILNLGWAGEEQDAHAEETLTVYRSSGPFWEEMLREFQEATGIRVRSFWVSPLSLLDQVIAEKSNPQADVLFAVPGGVYSAGIAEGIFEPYKPPTYELLDDRFKDPEGYWVGVGEKPLVFSTTKTFLEKHNLAPPSSWHDLLDPAYKGEIGLQHPGRACTGVTRVFSILEVFNRDEDKAFEYMKQLRTNVSTYSLLRGDMGAIQHVTNHLPEWWGFGTYSFPKEGIGSAVYAVALIKGAPHPEAAKKLIDWATSPAMQTLYAKRKLSIIPSHPDVQIAPSLAKVLEGVNVFTLDSAFMGANLRRIIDRWEKEVLP